MDNNGWAGEPGVPLNPAEPGFHWVEGCDGTATVVFWCGHGGDTHYENGDLKELNHWSGHPMWQAKEWRYLGPALTPAEVEARIVAAHKEWLAELNHDTDALMENARREGLEEAARWHDEQGRFWMEKGREVSALDSQSGLNLLAKAAEHRKHAATIRALKGEDNV